MPLLDRELLKKTGVIGLVSGELVFFVGGGYWLGSWLDVQVGLNSVFAAAMALLGLVYSGWRIWRLAESWMK